VQGEEDYELDPNAFDSILTDIDKVINSEAANNTKENYIKEIDQKFEGFHQQVKKDHEKTAKIVIDNFNNVSSHTETNKSTKSSKDKESKKSSKNPTAKPSSVKGKTTYIPDTNKIDSDLEDDCKKTKLDSLDQAYQTLTDNLNMISKKVQAVESLNTSFKKDKLEAIFSVDNNQRFTVSKLKRLEYLLNKNNKAMDLSWSKEDQSAKIKINENDSNLIHINANSCYNWYNTDQWFTVKDESFALEIEYETGMKSSHKNFYIGIQNEMIKPTSNCMCCNPENAVYMTRGGDVVCNKTRVNVKELSFDLQEKATIELTFICRKRKIFFSLNGGRKMGPYMFNYGESFRVVSGSCGTVNDTRLTIVNAHYL